jgi:hypothetical protein
MDNELTIDFIRMGIETLKKTGKLLPEEYKLRELPLAERKKAELQQINTLADIWANIFIGRNIDCDHWSTAVFLAAALEGREYAVITPALMQEGLRQEEAKRRAQASESSYSKPLAGVTPPTVSAKLWQWTKRKIAERRQIMPYMPSEGQVAAVANKLGLTQAEATTQRQLLRAYLNDWIYACKNQKPFSTKLWLDENHEVCYAGFC